MNPLLIRCLLCMYTNQYLNFRGTRLSGFGCMIGHKYYDAIVYADVISLIAPSMYALNKMCDICFEFPSEYDLKFNLSKCQLIKYGSRPDSPVFR